MSKEDIIKCFLDCKGEDNGFQLTLTNKDIDVIANEIERLNSKWLDEIQKEEEMEEWARELHSIIKEVREYITSYESISTIQGLEDIEANKDLDEKTLNEMVRRYMIIHDKLLEILDKGETK